MAIDKAVDSARLEADLTSVADAIRNKVGLTEPLSFPNGYIDALERMTGDVYLNASSIQFQNVDFNAQGVSVVEISNENPDGLSLEYGFSNAIAQKIIVNAKEIKSLQYSFQAGNVYSRDVLTEIVLHSETGYAGRTGWFRSAFFRRQLLTKISGAELDMSSSTNNTNTFTYCYALEDVRFKENSIVASLSMANSSHLKDATLVSLANGLRIGASTSTLTLHATSKARCSTLMGSNNDGTFVLDDQGTMTLTDFITIIKGWTIA